MLFGATRLTTRHKFVEGKLAQQGRVVYRLAAAVFAFHRRLLQMLDALSGQSTVTEFIFVFSEPLFTVGGIFRRLRICEHWPQLLY